MTLRSLSRAAGRTALPVLLATAALATPQATPAASAGTAIQDHHARLGGDRSVVGAPVTGELVTPDRIGRFTHYRAGSIYWTPSTHASEVHGSIRQTWAAFGWELSPLGYPVTDELPTPDGRGRYNHFQGGSVYWSPTTGAQEVHGSIRLHWASLGWELGPLGYPTSHEYEVPGGRASNFQGGRIVFHRATGRTTVEPGPASAAATSPGTVLDESGDGPDLRPYASTSTNGTNPLWHVEPGSDPVDRIGGKISKVSSEQFHRMFSTKRYGGPGKKLTISYRARATALRDRSGSSIVEGVKIGLKFPTSGTGYSKDDPRSVYGKNGASTSPGSYIFLTGITENGYMELARNPYGSGAYKFFPNKRVGYQPGAWRDVTVTVEWLSGSTVRVRYWHNADASGAPVYEAVDTSSPFASEPGFLWLRTDDADWEYDYLRVRES